MKQLLSIALAALVCWAPAVSAQVTTPNFGWTIPAEHQDPWYNSIVSLFNEIDATVASLSAGSGVGKTGSPLNSHCAFWTGTNTISGEAACTWDSVNDILKIGRLQALGTSVSIGTANSVTGTLRLLNSSNANESVVAATTPTATRTFTLPNADSNPVVPLSCAGVTFVKGVAGTGVIDCQTPTGSGNVSNVGTPTSGQIASWTTATSIQGLTLVPVAAGGTNLGTAADDALLVGNGTTWQSKVLPPCSGATNALAYNSSTNVFTCNTISGTGGTPTGTGFRHVTSGVEDAAAKLVDTADVNNSQITYAKIQDVSAASRLIGRGASGVGPAQEIILGTNLSMSSNTLNATGGTGTTPTGTGFNHVTAGVVDAAAKLVDTTDINNSQITYAKIQNVSAASRLLGRGDSGSGAPQEIVLGTGLSMSGTTLTATGGPGGGPTIAVVTADVAKQSSIAFTNVTGLTWPVCTTSTEAWYFDLTLLLAALNGNGDFVFQWTFPSGVTVAWQGISNADPPLPGGTPVVIQTEATQKGVGAVNGSFIARMQGWVFCSSASAGSMQLQYAQNASNAFDITVRKGSFISATKLIN